MVLTKYFPKEEIDLASNILKDFHGRLLLDSKVKNPIAIALSVYMSSNEHKTPFVDKKLAKEIFMSLGRKPTDFDKTLYEISGKRKESKTQLIDLNGDKIGLSFEGLDKVKEILKKDDE